MTLKKTMLTGAMGVLAMGGIGAGVASAATTAPAPAPPPATSSPTPGANTNGNTGDVQQGDQNGPDKAGAADKPEGGEAAEAPGTADNPGVKDGDNVQQGQQTGPDNAANAKGSSIAAVRAGEVNPSGAKGGSRPGSKRRALPTRLCEGTGLVADRAAGRATRPAVGRRCLGIRLEVRGRQERRRVCRR